MARIGKNKRTDETVRPRILLSTDFQGKRAFAIQPKATASSQATGKPTNSQVSKSTAVPSPKSIAKNPGKKTRAIAKVGMNFRTAGNWSAVRAAIRFSAVKASRVQRYQRSVYHISACSNGLQWEQLHSSG